MDMNCRFYYIFGKGAITLYKNTNSDTFIEKMKENKSLGVLYVYNDEYMYPNDLLEAYNHWDDYLEISEEEYKQYTKAIYE